MADQVYQAFIDGKVRQLVERLRQRDLIDQKAVLEEAAVVFPQEDVAPCDVVFVVREELNRRGIEHQL